MRAQPTELDRIYLDRLQREHPRAAIQVTRGFFDGSDTELCASFGSVPDEWDGSILVFEFVLAR